MFFVSPIDQVIAKDGADAVFVANEPRFLRESLRELAISKGILPEGESVSPDQLELPLDDADIKAAIITLMDEGKKSDFSGTGIPKVRSIERVLNRQITSDDRDRVWESIDDDSMQDNPA
jgi:hypothetical protein